MLCHSVFMITGFNIFHFSPRVLFLNQVIPLKLCKKKCRNYNIHFLKYWHRHFMHPVSFYRTKWMSALSEQWSRLMQALDHCRVTQCLHWMIARNYTGIGRLRRVTQCRHLTTEESFNTGTGWLKILSVKQYAQAVSCRMHALALDCRSSNAYIGSRLSNAYIGSRAQVLQYLPCL